MKKTGLVGLTLVLASGCGLAGGNNDLRPVELGLASAVTIGQAAQLALTAMEGSGEVRCASVVTACADYPCEGEVLITYGGGCPLPLGGEAIGTTTVTGTWSAEQEARLDFTFTDVQVGEDGAAVASATTIEAVQADGITTVEYTGTTALAANGAAVGGASSWDVEINDSGTPGDPSDDSYTIDGTNAGGAAGAGGGALSIEEVLVTPDCRLNPVGGTASITEAGLTNIRTDELTFHSACDGTAELETTLGGPDTVELNWFAED